MRAKKVLAIATGLTPAGISFAPGLANACAVCGLDGNGVASLAFKHSVLFMISAPYVTFVIIGGVMYMAWRRAQRRGDLSVAGSPKY